MKEREWLPHSTGTSRVRVRVVESGHPREFNTGHEHLQLADHSVMDFSEERCTQDKTQQPPKVTRSEPSPRQDVVLQV